MAQGNMFRKQRSVSGSQAQGPVQPYLSYTNGGNGRYGGYAEYAKSYGQAPVYSTHELGRYGSEEAGNRFWRRYHGLDPNTPERSAVLPPSPDAPVNPMGGSPSPEALRGRNIADDIRPSGVSAFPTGFGILGLQEGVNRLSNASAVQAFNRFTPGQQPNPGSQRPTLSYSPAQSQAVRRQYAGNNPIAPAAAETQANAAFMFGNPGFGTSSLDATQRFNGMTANNAFQSSMVNGYVGQAQIASPFDEQASRARAQEYMRGGPAADPTNLGARFGNVAPRISDEQRRAQDYATSQAAMAERMRTQMPTDRAQNVFVKPSRDGQGLAYTDRGQALRNMPENTPGLADAIALDDAQRQANVERMAKRLEDFKAANGGMNAQAVGRQRRQDRREQGKYDKAVRQGLNPMSPQAQALFPEQTQSFMQQRLANRGGAAVQNPMAAPERTMAGQQQSAQRVAELAATNPAIAGLGVTPDQGMIGLHTALGSRLDEDPNLSLSDDELKAYQQYAREMSNLSTDQNNQFDFGGTPFDKYSGELWKELAGLPDNQRAREEWLKKYKGRNNAATGAATAIPPAGTYFMGGPVGR